MATGPWFIIFDSDWREPPGTIVHTFATRWAAEQFVGDHADYGYSILEVPPPEEPSSDAD